MTKCKKSCAISFIDNILHHKKEFSSKYIKPFLLLGVRLLIADIFLRSGLTKLHNFDSTVFLFEYEYMVPLLHPVIGAYMATFIEIVCASLILFGLATRFSSIPLLVLAIVIQFAIIQNHEHYYWIALLVTSLIYGPGYFSMDNLIRRKVEEFKSKKK